MQHVYACCCTRGSSSSSASTHPDVQVKSLEAGKPFVLRNLLQQVSVCNAQRVGLKCSHQELIIMLLSVPTHTASWPFQQFSYCCNRTCALSVVDVCRVCPRSIFIQTWAVANSVLCEGFRLRCVVSDRSSEQFNAAVGRCLEASSCTTVLRVAWNCARQYSTVSEHTRFLLG